MRTRDFNSKEDIFKTIELLLENKDALISG